LVFRDNSFSLKGPGFLGRSREQSRAFLFPDVILYAFTVMRFVFIVLQL